MNPPTVNCPDRAAPAAVENALDRLRFEFLHRRHRLPPGMARIVADLHYAGPVR